MAEGAIKSFSYLHMVNTRSPIMRILWPYGSDGKAQIYKKKQQRKSTPHQILLLHSYKSFASMPMEAARIPLAMAKWLKVKYGFSSSSPKLSKQKYSRTAIGNYMVSYRSLL